MSEGKTNGKAWKLLEWDECPTCGDTPEVKAWAATINNEIRFIDMKPEVFQLLSELGYKVIPVKVTPIVTKRKG